MDKLLDLILARTYTKEQALIRLSVLKDLILVKLFQQDSKEEDNRVKTKPKKSLLQQTSWIASLGASIYQQFNRDNVYQKFTVLEKQIKTIQPLVVYVPMEIPEQSLEEIGNYLRKTYGPRFLLDIQVDPSLIAGAALVWKGIYKDYSLKKKIEENRTLILNSLQEFLRKEQVDKRV